MGAEWICNTLTPSSQRRIDQFFTRAYWNAKSIGRFIDGLIDFAVDWLAARFTNPFLISSEKNSLDMD